jgi:hypothetical protein
MTLDFKKPTDKEHKETLESKIIRASWSGRIACVGSRLGLEVLTHFVGDASDIEVEIKDKSGKTIGKTKGQVYADRFDASITVPEDAKDALIFSAKLPKHGLKESSLPVRVIRVRNLKWGQKEAMRGELVKLSGDVEGMPENGEVTVHIYEHDQDGAHDFVTRFPIAVKNRKIQTEWKCAYVGDTEQIPTEEEMQRHGRSYSHPEYFFTLDAGGSSARSDLLRLKDWTEIRLRDHEGIPMADEEYVLGYADGSEARGKTDSEGYARVDRFPPGKVIVRFPRIQELDLIEEESGEDEDEDTDEEVLTTE